MALLTQESLVPLSRHPSWELWLGCWLLLELGGCRRQAVNRKWLSKSRWNMPGAGAGQEIAEQLNGLKRMLCPPPWRMGCPPTPALRGAQPGSSLTASPSTSAGAGGGTEKRGAQGTRKSSQDQ